MNLEINRTGDVVVVGVVGTLDHAATVPFIGQVSDLLGKDSPRLVFNLRRMPFIDSTGISQVWHVVKMARGAGGDVAFAEASPAVQSLLDSLGMREVVRIYATEGEATLAMSRTPPP